MYSYPPFSQPPNIKSVIKTFFKSRSVLSKLVIVNIAVYLAFVLFRLILLLIAFLFNSNIDTKLLNAIIHFFAVPASFITFAYQPWSMVTSLFLHYNFWHIFMNMFMLIVAGRIFKTYLGDKILLIIYFVGGIAGSLLYQFSYQVFPVFQPVLNESYALGASGSIMAILAAITIYKPKHELHLLFIGKVKLYWIMLFFILIDLMSIPHGNAGGHIAHLGGALCGVLYMLFYTKIPSLKKVKKKKKKFYTSYTHTSGSARPVSDEEYNSRKKAEQDYLDKILDKISKYGYGALSKEEKEFLFSQSKR